MCTSFSSSPSISFVTGIPVQAATISAMLSAVTSSRRSEPGPWSAARAASCSLSRAWSWGRVSYWSLAAVS